AFYYCNHFKGIGDFIESLNDDSLAIIKAKKLFKDPRLQVSWHLLRATYST
ncbi:Hypothetical protein FKW44_003339, partial [Caligus rogercresseyi]